MKKLILFLLSSVMLAGPTGTGELWIYDQTAPTVLVKVSQIATLSKFAGASSIRFVWGYSATEPNNSTLALSCVLPCSAVMDTTQTVWYKLQTLDLSGNLINSFPVSPLR